MKITVKIYCLHWWIWLLTPLIAHGQYDFVEFLSKENGMPFTRVTDAATDSKGYLWLGAEQGLFRFDGLNFVHVPLISGKDSIYLRNIYKIEIDKDDRIYCSFLNNGLGVFDPHTFELTHYLGTLSASGLSKIDAANLSISHFGRGYGLLPAQLLTLGSLPGNRLFLGTLDGYYTFQPASNMRNSGDFFQS